MPDEGPAERNWSTDPDGSAQPDPDGDPMPIPIVTAVFSVPFGYVSTAAVSSAVTVPPDWPTVNWSAAVGPTPPIGAASVPEKGNVFVAAELGDVVVTPPLLHPAVIARTVASAAPVRSFVISINVDTSIKVLAPVFSRLL